jgi:hypothetical protein
MMRLIPTLLVSMKATLPGETNRGRGRAAVGSDSSLCAPFVAESYRKMSFPVGVEVVNSTLNADVFPLGELDIDAELLGPGL